MDLDWKNLGFTVRKTDYNVRCVYQDGKWGARETSTDDHLSIHIGATCLHYGQESFEGLKAYRGADNRIRLFRPWENARRMIRSARGILLAEPPEELFLEAVEKVVLLNSKYVPPYGTGATLYIRPLLIGTGPEVGVRPSKEYTFLVFVMPVGPYFKEGFKPVNMLICRDHDRAAPLGTGHLKVGGNYAASMSSVSDAHEKGYATAMYLDAIEKKYIDECGPANFFGIRDNTYITPASRSILPSITNKSLQVLADSFGMKVEQRKVPVEELAQFEEAGACGTAAVISPIGKVVDEEMDRVYSFGDGVNPGPVITRLYQTLTGIQNGDLEDTFDWTKILE
ncbi:MAG TPA: branched-chain amino acid aminotransferase [Bacteroides sp.]|nr:branched-chain amino acid aminotransferase [Bacteroides sp.]